MKNVFGFHPVVRVTTFATALAFVVAGSISLPGYGADGAESCEKKAKHKASASKDAPNWVTSSVMIKAPPSEVWKSIHEERANDPDLSYSKVVEQISPHELKLEQKFNFIPVIGSSVCLMHQTEIPNERIDYELLHSDRFKTMEGSWILTPAEEGRETKLQLTSRLDLGIPVPRSFMDSVTGKKIERRLSHVKAMAEKNASNVAAKANAKPE